VSGSTVAGVLMRCSDGRRVSTTTSTWWSNWTDASRLIELLDDFGYRFVVGAPPKSFVMVDRRGRQVDFHPVTFDADGGGIYQMEDEKEWLYPAEGFTGWGSVDERAVRCVSAEVQVLVHVGYELTDKDYRELFLLRERFGVEPPEALLARVLAAARDDDAA
jgi:hypothetical protein